MLQIPLTVKYSGWHWRLNGFQSSRFAHRQSFSFRSRCINRSSNKSKLFNKRMSKADRDGNSWRHLFVQGGHDPRQTSSRPQRTRGLAVVVKIRDRPMCELIHPIWVSSAHSTLTRVELEHKTDTVLNDETSEIERDLCAFGPIGAERPSS